MPANDETLNKIRIGKFRENNGVVIRTINILRTKYVRLKDIRHAHPEITEGEIMDCIHYLQEEGYIHLRHCETKCEVQLADTDERDMLEAKVTGKGIKLLSGSIKDSEIIV